MGGNGGGWVEWGVNGGEWGGVGGMGGKWGGMGGGWMGAMGIKWGIINRSGWTMQEQLPEWDENWGEMGGNGTNKGRNTHFSQSRYTHFPGGQRPSPQSPLQVTASPPEKSSHSPLSNAHRHSGRCRWLRQERGPRGPGRGGRPASSPARAPRTAGTCGAPTT